MGLVEASTRNDAVKAAFKEIVGTAYAVIPMLLYAAIVTSMAVIPAPTVSRSASKAKSGFKMKVFECEICKFSSKIESEVMERNLKEHLQVREIFVGLNQIVLKKNLNFRKYLFLFFFEFFVGDYSCLLQISEFFQQIQIFTRR